MRSIAIVICLLLASSLLQARAQDVKEKLRRPSFDAWWYRGAATPDQDEVQALVEAAAAGTAGSNDYFWLAQAALRGFHPDCDGVDKEKADELFKEAFARRSPLAVVQVAITQDSGRTPSQIEAGFRYAMDQGEPGAFLEYGKMRLIENGPLPRDVSEARRALERAAELGASNAYYFLASIAREEGNPDRELHYLSAGSERGSPNAAFEMAKLLNEGHRVPPDPQRAVRLMEFAAASMPKAKLEFAKMLGSGYAGVRQDVNKAKHLIREASQNGDADTRYECAVIFLSGGYGQSADIEAGLSLLEALAKDEDADASFALGKLLLEGLLVPRDQARAERLIRKAADAGDPSAMIYIRWFEHAARSGRR